MANRCRIKGTALLMRVTVDKDGKKIVDTEVKIKSLSPESITAWNKAEQKFKVRRNASLDSDFKKECEGLNDDIAKISKAITKAVDESIDKDIAYLKTVPKLVITGKYGEESGLKEIIYLDEIVNKYIKEATNTKNPQQYLSQAKHIPYQRKIETVSARWLNKYIDDLRSKEDLAPSTIRGIIKLIKASLKYLSELIDDEEVKPIKIRESALIFKIKKNKMPVEYRKRDFIVTLLDEEVKLIESPPVELKPHLKNARLLILSGLNLGLRSNDLLRVAKDSKKYIKYKDNGDIDVKIRTGKTGAEVELPIDKVTAKRLESAYSVTYMTYKNQIRRLFKVCGLDRNVEYVTKTGVKKETKKLWQVAGTHIVRRSFITSLLKSGELAPHEIQALSTHKSINSFYAYVSKDASDGAIEKYRERFINNKK